MEGFAIESIAIELTICKFKWVFLNCYKPPSVKTAVFQQELSQMLDKATSFYKPTTLQGDLNCDMLKENGTYVHHH